MALSMAADVLMFLNVRNAGRPDRLCKMQTAAFTGPNDV